jgi:hypothetical protein
MWNGLMSVQLNSTKLYNMLRSQNRIPVSIADYNPTILYYREKAKNWRYFNL